MRAPGSSCSSRCSGSPSLASRNGTRCACARTGGVEFGAAHYPLMVALHAFWLLGLWLLGHGRSVDPLWLAVFVLLQAGRVWVIASLGRRWTTRIIVLPGVGADRARALSLAAPPELSDRGAGDRGGAAGARPAGVRACSSRSPIWRCFAYRIQVENRALAWAAQGAPSRRQPLPMRSPEASYTRAIRRFRSACEFVAISPSLKQCWPRCSPRAI